MRELPTEKAVSIWSYDGRSPRVDYFVVILVTSVIGALSGLFMVKGGALGIFGGMVFVAALWVSVCACARRLHDVGHSGWWSLAALVPGANFILGLYVLFASGQDHDNEYGPSPMNPPSQSLPPQKTSAQPLLGPRTQDHQPALALAVVNAEVISSRSETPETPGAEPKEEFWAQALQECDSSSMKAGLWAKAYAVAGGDERIAKATYMRLRAAQLQTLYDEEQQALMVARDLELQAEQEKQRAQEAEVAEVLAKMTEAKRAEALLPKGKCPACGDVIPLASEQCPKCTALFTEDSKWRVMSLSKYEALMQKSVDDEVIRATRSKEEKESDNARQLIFLGVVVLLAILMVVKSQ